MKKLLIAVAVVGMASGLVARADTMGQTLSFNLNQDGCTNGCGTGSTVFGTVLLTYNGTGVTVLETLNSPSEFVESAGDSLAFDLSVSPISITSLSSGFTVVGGTNTAGTWSVSSGSIHEPPFGDYDYAVTCGGTSCGPGASTKNAGPLTFTINGVTLEDFTGTTSMTYGDVFFSSDIIGPTGNTGDVGADGPGTPGGPTPTPEPSSLALLGTGALGLAGVVRRKFRRA
jgi:hypothetical protein